MRWIGIALVCSIGCGAPRVAATAARPEAPSVPAEFQQRIDAYVALHRRAAAAVPPTGTTNDSAALRTRRKALAEAVRRARPNAQQGDIFTPAVVPYFRSIVKTDLKTRDGEEKSAALEEVPQVPFKIYDEYPEDGALASVPPMLLAHLPRLPEELEYRFFARSLILLDVSANLIVDYIPGLVAPTS